MTPIELLRKEKDENKSNKNIAKIENSFIETYMIKANIVPLKILFYIARSNLKRNDEVLRTITIDTKRMCEYCNIDIKTLRNQIRNNLMKTSILTIDNNFEEEYITLVPRAKFLTNKNILEIDIYNKISNMILEVENKYTAIDTQNLMRLRTKHSLKMIQILEMIDNFSENVAKRKKYSLEELNGLFGTKYINCYEFERKILKSAKDELDSESKLSFIYETIYKDSLRGRPKSVGFTINLKLNKCRQGSLF